MSLESERLAAQIFRFLDGHEQEVVDWLVKLGCTVTIPGDSLTAPVLRGPTGVTGALGGDPMALAATMAMILWGEYWLYITPTLMDDVRTIWHARPKPPKEQKELPVAERNEQLSFLADNDHDRR